MVDNFAEAEENDHALIRRQFRDKRLNFEEDEEHAIEDIRDSEDDTADEDEEGVTDELFDLLVPPFKSGPLSADLLEDLHSLHEDFQQKVINLAKRHNKSPDILLSQVGRGFPSAAGRSVTGWSAWQAYFAKMNKKKPKDVPLNEWTKEVVVHYEAYIEKELRAASLPNTPANRRRVLEPIVQWYKDMFIAN
ncbi:hypothetical protein H0H92_000364, partial [Tricholoma furcatifolium]